MGAVYQARQIELDRLVAIKLLPLEISVDKDFADRFRREARAMAKLHHPNIITVFDFGKTSEGHLFFVMEYVEGANLADIIHQVGLDGDQALSIVEQACTALAYAHGKGIVHRDIKPANVMIDTESHVKVADFGLARLTDGSITDLGHTMTGTVMGTPDYMAPEQMKGMNVDHRADIYSLGVMVYEMLCREVPRGIFQPPSLRTGCDTRIDQIVVKAMQQAPDHRYQSTQEMKADVSAARVPLTMMPTGPTQVVHPTPVKKPALPGPPKPVVMKAIRPPAESRKSKLPLYAGIAAAVLALIGGATFFAKSEPKRATSKKIEDATPGPASAALEPGAIKLWDTPEKLAGSKSARWEDGAMRLDEGGSPRVDVRSRDGILRARIRRNKDATATQLLLRDNGSSAYYRLTLQFTNVELSAIVDGKALPRLAQWPLPREYGPDEWPLLEFTIVGDELSASIDGHPLGVIHDSTITQAGSVSTFATAKGYFRDIVYVSLDKPGDPAAPAAEEAWQDLLHDAGQLELPDTAERTAQGLRFTGGEAKMPASQPPKRDGAVRLRASFGGSSPQLRFHQKDGSYLQLYVSGNNKVTLDRRDAVTQQWTSLREFAVPAALQVGRGYELELRVAGPSITAKLNGKILGGMTDGAIKPGRFCVGISGDAHSAPVLVESFEFLDLSNPVALPPGPLDPVRPVSASPAATATREAPFVNSLGMKFVPVPITGGPTGGQRVLFGIWDTRVQDYVAYEGAKKVDDSWTKQEKDGVPVGRELNQPVVGVSWEDAQAFCQWLTEKEIAEGKLPKGLKYRLPSDEEWSWAVGLPPELGGTPAEKAGKNSVDFPWGKDYPPTTKVGNYADEAFHAKFPLKEDTKNDWDKNRWIEGYTDGYATTSPVESFPANAYGLYDMGGNVFEWCEDWFDASHKDRVLRGAGWNVSDRRYLLSSSRVLNVPGHRGIYDGFRCVLAPAADAPPASGVGGGPASPAPAEPSKPAVPATIAPGAVQR